MRAEKHVVLAEEDPAEFAALAAALVAELAPVGARQTALARRVAVAAWRLARADRIEVELFAERSWGANPSSGLAMIRDGNGTRSFETLLRYRAGAMAEFWRALKTLKALQAEQAAGRSALAGLPQALSKRRAPPPPVVAHLQPDEPEHAAARGLEYVPSAPTAPARALHEAGAPWLPNEPERRGAERQDVMPDTAAPARAVHEAAPWLPNEPEGRGSRRSRQGERGA